MSSLINLNCTTNYQNEQPLTDKQITAFIKELTKWNLDCSNEITKLNRTFMFKDYLAAVEFTNQVAQIAQAQNHHPEILLSYDKVKVSWWTHAMGGLHQNDFICAAKTEQLHKP